jgi:hypothetical protein
MGATRQPQMNEPKTQPFTVEGGYLSPPSAVVECIIEAMDQGEALSLHALTPGHCDPMSE